MSHELQAELLRLKAQKAKAVEEEDYEAAAVLKRKIKVLEDTEASLRVDYGPLPQHAQHAEPEKAALKEVKEALKEREHGEDLWQMPPASMRLVEEERIFIERSKMAMRQKDPLTVQKTPKDPKLIVKMFMLKTKKCFHIFKKK